MKRWVKWTAVAGVLGAAALLMLPQAATSALPVGAKAPDFTTRGALAGKLFTLRLSEHLKKGPVVLYFFPVPARYAVMILGAIAFLSSVGSSGDGVAHVAHLGGLLVGYLYLKGRRGPLDELKYRWLKWRLGRTRAKFDVYEGGRRGPSTPGPSGDWTKEWKKHVH